MIKDCLIVLIRLKTIRKIYNNIAVFAHPILFWFNSSKVNTANELESLNSHNTGQEGHQGMYQSGFREHVKNRSRYSKCHQNSFVL